MLVDPEKNPWRNQRYEVMIQKFNLKISVRQLQRRIRTLTKNARRYKQATYKDDLSEATMAARREYSKRHKDYIVKNFW